MHEQRSLSIERQICCQLVHKEDHLLCDVLGGGANSADSKENIVTEEVASQHLDLFRESSRKHHSLPSILRSKRNRHSKGLPLSKLQIQVVSHLGMLSCSTILRIWGSKPMSSIRSASSRQRYLKSGKSDGDTFRSIQMSVVNPTYLQHSRLILPRSRKSTRRPGVATNRWHPLSSSRIWSPTLAPPYTTAGRTLDR